MSRRGRRDPVTQGADGGSVPMVGWHAETPSEAASAGAAPPNDGDGNQQSGKPANKVPWNWIFASVPFIYACIRLVVVARGDPETLKALALSLDVKALALGTILPFGSTLLLWAFVFMVAASLDPKNKGKANRRAWLVLSGLLAPVAIVVILFGMPVRYLVFNGILIVVYGLAAVGGELKSKPLLRACFKMLGFTWVAVVIGLVVYAFVALGMWLPKERLTVKNGDVTGYVLSEADGWTTYLDEQHDVHKIETGSITQRELIGRGTERHQESLAEYLFGDD